MVVVLEILVVLSYKSSDIVVSTGKKIYALYINKELSIRYSVVEHMQQNSCHF